MREEKHVTTKEAAPQPNVHRSLCKEKSPTLTPEQVRSFSGYIEREAVCQLPVPKECPLWGGFLPSQVPKKCHIRVRDIEDYLNQVCKLPPEHMVPNPDLHNIIQRWTKHDTNASIRDILLLFSYSEVVSKCKHRELCMNLALLALRQSDTLPRLPSVFHPSSPSISVVDHTLAPEEGK